MHLFTSMFDSRGMRLQILTAMVFAPLLLFAKTPDQGQYARRASPVWDLLFNDKGESKPVVIFSPDRRLRLNALYVEQKGDSGVLLTLHKAKLTFWTQLIQPGVGLEVLWSPDSRAFFVSTSDAGRGGWYSTHVYLLDKQNKVSEIDVSDLVVSAFGHPVRCGWHEDPNVAGIRWSVASKRIIVAGQIAPHSNCDSFGTFRAYEIAVPEGKLLRSWGQIEAKRMFHDDLGWDLIDAPDNCIRHPKACEVAYNHENGKRPKSK